MAITKSHLHFLLLLHPRPHKLAAGHKKGRKGRINSCRRRPDQTTLLLLPVSQLRHPLFFFLSPPRARHSRITFLLLRPLLLLPSLEAELDQKCSARVAGKKKSEWNFAKDDFLRRPRRAKWSLKKPHFGKNTTSSTRPRLVNPP